MIMEHLLKIMPEYYTAVSSGAKTFEVRLNDRDFKVDDILVLREWFDSSYTGRLTIVRVDYVLKDTPHLLPNYCVMAITLLI